jgi:predicted PP-loop superfamily ATPase
MVEVFKTNVNSREHARMLLTQMHRIHADYKANFDLEDCDRILRVECMSGTVNSSTVINLLKKSGFMVEILTDEVIAPGFRFNQQFTDEKAACRHHLSSPFAI